MECADGMVGGGAGRMAGGKSLSSLAHGSRSLSNCIFFHGSSSSSVSGCLNLCEDVLALALSLTLLEPSWSMFSLSADVSFFRRLEEGGDDPDETEGSDDVRLMAA